MSPEEEHSTGSGGRARSRLLLVLPLLLVAAFALRTVLSARHHSVTVDEFAYLPAGLVHLVRQDFRFADLNPPLARVLQALPVLAMQPDLPPAPVPTEARRRPWEFGYAFQEANRESYRALFGSARLVTTLLGTLLGVVVFLWSRRVWGPPGAVVSLAFLAFEPNLVAHSGLVTTDVPFCLAAILALWAGLRILQHRGTGSVLIAGLALGLAQLMKFTALLLYPALLIVTLLIARPLRGALARLGGAVLVSLFVLNAGYLFEGSFRLPGSRSFESPVLRPLERLPLPLPANYLESLDLKGRQIEGRFVTYLNGRLYRGDAPWYHDLEALLLKTPLAGLGLMLGTLIVVPRAGQGPARVAALAWGSTGAVLLLASCLTDLNLGLRHVLLLYPLVALAAGGLVSRFPRLVILGLLLYAAESLAAYPHELAFFNAAAGGPGGGLRFLARSNIDWGQDLPALRRFIDEQQPGPLRLAYFGRVDPRLYGIEFTLPQEPLRPGWYAVSANFVAGIPYLLYDARTGEARRARPDEFRAFRELTPVARVGASIYVYHVPP